MENEARVTVSEEYLRTMERKVEDLKTLMEVSALISSTLDFNEVVTLVMEKAKNVMDAEACSILLYNKETNKLEFEVAICNEEHACDILKKKVTVTVGEGIAGWVAENLKPLIICDVNQDYRFTGHADKQTGFVTKSLIAVPLIGRSGLIGVAEILNPRGKECFEDYDSEVFQTLCRQVGIAIENSLFHEESLVRERMRQELDIASSLQKSFLPESPVLKRGDLTVSATNISAAKVGGDIYDFITPPNGKVGVLIGDVSGKGVSAALYMAKLISDFRYTAHHAESPEMVFDRLNAQLSRSPRGMFLTAVYMLVDPATGDLQVACAGHPPFLWLTQGEVHVMSVPSGPPLGIIPTEYMSTSLPLKKGDRLLLLTDGVFDAKNRDGERIGYEDIVRFVRAHMHEDRLVETVVDYVDEFTGDMDRADDLTIVELRWGG